MKRTLLLTIISTTLLFTTHAGAQYLFNANDSTLPRIEFGLKAGVNMQTLTGETWDNSFKPGIAGGMYVGMQKNKVGVRVEILANTSRYTSKSITDSFGNHTYTVTDSAGDRGDFRATYLNIPLLFEYNVFSYFWLQAGPQYSIVMSVKNLTRYDGDPKVIFKQGELSGVIGIEARFRMHITGGLRYIYGFTNMNNDIVGSTDTWQNRTIQLFAAYRIK
jgi:outer membrane immunogenic protein